MWFSRKNNGETVTDDSRILQLLKEIAAEVGVYGAKVTKIEQDCKTLRSLVNRKLGNDFGESDTTETNKSGDSFDTMRALNKKFPNQLL